MLLIADSGSTKTDWVAIADGKVAAQCTTQGLNPNTCSAERLHHVCDEAASQLPTRPETLFFYGSGCGNDNSRQLMNDILRPHFPFTTLCVESDMLGACRAACGTSAGIVGILGTGSNACLYDGTVITSCPPSLGFILGDEGSGNHIGRLLLKAFFSHQMPASLEYDFECSYHPTVADTVRHIYQQEHPNQFLASFAPFAARHRDNPFIANMLSDVFDSFFATLVLPLVGQDTPRTSNTLHATGSIALFFKPELGLAASRHHLLLATTDARPIEKLVVFHQNHTITNNNKRY